MRQPERIISVQYGFNVNDLLGGWDNRSRYDVEVCTQKYTNLCREELEQEYPNAKVEILSQDGATGVLPTSMQTEVLRRDYQDEDVYEISYPEEIEIVEHLCSTIRESYEWVVHRPWINVGEAHKRFNVPIPIIRWACQEGLIEEAEKTDGDWEFPLHTFSSELQENAVFVNCQSVIGIGVAGDGTRTFRCYSEEEDVWNFGFPTEVDTLLIVSNRFGIPLFDQDNSSLSISKHAGRIELVFEHFLGNTPWTDKRWAYDTYAKTLASQAEKYEFVESALRENTQSGRTFVEGVQFKFHYLPSSTLHEAVNQAATILKDVFRETEIHLSGGPEWRKEYKKDESLFCKQVLSPLLRKMGFESVQYIHGTDEFGKDLIFSEVTRFGELQYWGLQAKAGDISGRVNSGIEAILGQVEDAFAMPYREINGEKRYISTLVIAISGHFTRNAKEKIREKMPKHFVGSVYFWDRDKILTLIANHWASHR